MSRTRAEESTPGSPAPGCVPAPTRKRFRTSSLALCGRNQALCVSVGSSPKPAPRYGVEPVLEIERRRDPRRDDVPRKARQNRRFERLLDRLAVGFGLDPPVLSALQVGDRREHVEGVATLGRERRIGRGRAMQVEAEIGRERACGRKYRAGVRDSGGPAGWCDARRRRSGGRRRNTRRRDPSNSGRCRSCGPSIVFGSRPARDGDRSRRNRRSRPRRSPERSRPTQARRPFAAPSSTRIVSTSSPQRISPPCDAIRPARPATSFPVPPIAKCTPQRFSRKGIRQ